MNEILSFESLSIHQPHQLDLMINGWILIEKNFNLEENLEFEDYNIQISLTNKKHSSQVDLWKMDGTLEYDQSSFHSLFAVSSIFFLQNQPISLPYQFIWDFFRSVE